MCVSIFGHDRAAVSEYLGMQIQRQEDDIRTRVSNASDAYRKAVTDTQATRQEYFNFQLPRILRVSTAAYRSDLY
jgi:hypothetical protein